VSWTPSSPHAPRDDTRDDTVYNVPVRRVSQPPRFPGFLLAAVIAALIAFAALGAMLFSNRAEAPPASVSPRPTASGLTGAGSPGASSEPVPSSDTDPSGPPASGASGATLVDEVCAEPVANASGMRPSLAEVFREYCREGIPAVLAEVDADPGSIRELAWGYAADRPPVLGADLAHYVYIAQGDQRRIRRYLVSSDTVGRQPTVTEAGRVQALPADIFFSLSDEDS